MTGGGPEDGKVVCNFPMYRGRTLDEIAATADGLLYLDWLVGYMEEQKDYGRFYACLVRFLARPGVAHDLERAMEGKRSSRPPDPKPRPWWEGGAKR